MGHAKGNNIVFVKAFDLPETQRQFDALSIAQKSVLYRDYPETYKRFTHKKERKPWEK